MKGLNYKSTQTYSYEKSNEEMKRILEYDGLKNWQLNDDCKIVEYTIDHSMQMTLSLLIYLQEIKFIRLTIAQNIQLCLAILNKYQELQKQNIQHNYLSSDRILINLTDKQHQITIFPEKLVYTIHFLGYDCPFYERDNYKDSKKKDDQSIKEIIINIIQLSKKQSLIDKQKGKQLINDNKMSDEKQKAFNQKYADLVYIFKVLLDGGIFKSFDQFIEASKIIFEKYNNQNNKNQRLTIVDIGFTKQNFKRQMRIEDVSKNLEQIQQQYYKDGQSYEIQQILQTIFPLITNEFRTAIRYEYQNPPKNDDTYINLKQELSINNEEMINQIINENKDEILKEFKFELDLQSIKDDINSQLQDNQLKILNYFLNNVKFSVKQKDNKQSIQHIQIQIQKLKTELITEIIVQTLENFVQLQLMQITQDMA